MDIAANNNVVVESVQQRIDIEYKGKFFDLRYVCHTVNLIAQTRLRKINHCTPQIKITILLIRHGSRQQSFSKYVKI